MWTCVDCGCRNIAADLTVCPGCGEERIMPKATSGGASNAWEENEPGAQAPVAPTPVAVPTATDAAENAAPAEPAAPAAAEPPAAPAAPVDVTSMSKAELQAHADSLGLPTDGTKADLAARITDHVETATSVPTEVAP